MHVAQVIKKPGIFANGKVTCLLFEDNNCGAILVGAQQFCFGRFDSETSTCQGNLLGMVNSAEDCCGQFGRGLGGGGYVGVGSQDCMSCMRFTGKVLLRDTRLHELHEVHW